MSDQSVLMIISARCLSLLPVTPPGPIPSLSLSHFGININSIIHHNVPRAQLYVIKIDAREPSVVLGLREQPSCSLGVRCCRRAGLDR